MPDTNGQETFNPSAVLLKQAVKAARILHESNKFFITLIDDSPGAQKLRENTKKNEIFRYRYQHPTIEIYRNRLLGKKDNESN